MAAMRKSPAMRFLDETLPLYHEPLVTVKFKPADGLKELKVVISKDRICSSSRVFDRMLNGRFKEAVEQTIEFPEMKNVVTCETVVGFIRWLYDRDVVFDAEAPFEQRVSDAIELARFGELYLITGLERATIRYIVKNIVIPDDVLTMSNSYRNTFWMTPEHVISALHLPQEHEVRVLMAFASVEGYLRRDHYKFEGLAAEYPEYGSDIIRIAGKMLFGIWGPGALRSSKRWLAGLPA